MEKYPAVTIEKWLTDGWKLYKRNGLTFSFASVLAALICIPTSFIFFSGPLYAGLHYMALKSMRGGRPRIRDIFKGFKRYWGTFFLWLISSALTVLLISTGIGILFLPLLWAISMLAFPLLIDQGQDVEGTFHKAFKAVFTWRWKDWRGALKNWRRFWLFGLALPFIASIGVLGCFVGIFITIPLVVCAQATAYRDIFKTDAAFQLNARDLDPISRLSELRDWIFEEIDSANESTWDRPYLDGATFHYYADVRKALLHFEVRVLDGLHPPLTEVQRRQHENLNEIWLHTDAATLVYLRGHPRNSDPDTWPDCLKYAIDVDALLQSQYGATYPQIALTPFQLPYNRVKARRRFKHADSHPERTLNLIHAPLPDNTGRAIAMRLQRDYFSQVGLEVTVEATDPSAFRQSLSDSDYDVALLSTPIYQESDIRLLDLSQTDLSIPLYLLPASFLCQSKMRGIDMGWGGAIKLEGVWLMK